MSALHVSKDRVVHQQELILVYWITQLCTIVRMCPAALVLLLVTTIVQSCVRNTEQYD